MMLTLAVIALGVSLCCPLTIPFWVFVILGFHCYVRKECQHKYVLKHGAEPRLFTSDWWLLRI